jgi:hypothetical protein
MLRATGACAVPTASTSAMVDVLPSGNRCCIINIDTRSEENCGQSTFLNGLSSFTFSSANLGFPDASSASARRGRAVADMTKDEIEQMAAGRSLPEHDHLNSLLDGT